MRKWVWLAWTAALVQGAALVNCSSDDSSQSNQEDAGACEAADGGIATYVAGGNPSPECGACLTSTCPGTLTACADDCTCNEQALGGLACLAELGGAPTLDQTESCLTTLVGSSDQTTTLIAGCLNECASACGGAESQCESDGGEIDAGLAAHFGSQADVCASCVETSCDVATSECIDDCACNPVAAAALDCLSGLTSGDDASADAENACLAALLAGDPDSGLSNLGQCITSACAAECSGSFEPDAGDDGDGGALQEAGLDSTADAPFDAGPDAASDDASDDGG